MDVAFWWGLVSGGVGAEAIRHVASRILKRHEEKKTTQRKMLVSDVEALAKSIDPLLKAATAYYGMPSSQGTELSRQIKFDLRAFARLWGSTNKRLQDAGFKQLESRHLVAFRKALTTELDIERTVALPIDSPTNVALLGSADVLHELFSKLRFSLA